MHRMTATLRELALDNKNWVDEPDADPDKTKWVSSWAATPKSLARLAGFPALEGLWIGDGGRKNQPAIAGMRRLRVLRLNGVTGNDLDFLSGFASLQLLELSSLKATSLGGLEKLQRLECLILDHAPNLKSLQEIGGLGGLEELFISTPASWDLSQKCIEVDTLKPLARLAELKLLTLRGVRPGKDALRPLAGLKSLRKVEISHVPSFTVEDFASLAGALPRVIGNCLKPHFRMNFPARCKHCGATLEWLTGSAGRRRSLCPICDKDKLAAHVAEFMRIKQSVAVS